MIFKAVVPHAQGATSASSPTKQEIEKLLAFTPNYSVEIRLPGIDFERQVVIHFLPSAE